MFIAEEKANIMHNNIILNDYLHQVNTKPLDKKQLFKFLEELMDKKFEMDSKDLKEQVKPMSMPEFLINYSFNLFGIEKSSEKNISKVIFSLTELYKSNDQYSKIYCSLFQILSDPVPYEVSIFLTKTRCDFQSIIYKYEKLLLSHGKKPRTSHNPFYGDYIENGGFASLGDTIDLMLSIFSCDKYFGKLALQKIKPNNITLEEYVSFQICQKIVRIGKSSESIFAIIDKDSSETID